MIIDTSILVNMNPKDKTSIFSKINLFVDKPEVQILLYSICFVGLVLSVQIFAVNQSLREKDNLDKLMIEALYLNDLNSQKEALDLFGKRINLKYPEISYKITEQITGNEKTYLVNFTFPTGMKINENHFESYLAYLGLEIVEKKPLFTTLSLNLKSERNELEGLKQSRYNELLKRMVKLFQLLSINNTNYK